jgi:hypothetical protein
VSYEETVTDQDRVLGEVAQRLGLDDVEAMRAMSTRASRSSSLSTEAAVEAIRGGDREAQVAGWQARVSDADRDAVARILDRFGVTLYSAASDEPDWSGYR